MEFFINLDNHLLASPVKDSGNNWGRRHLLHILEWKWVANLCKISYMLILIFVI